MSSRESRLARLESRIPEPQPNVRLLAPRAPFSWLPRGVTRLTATQSEIFLSPARFRVAIGGRRSGKTTLSVSELIRAARSGFHRVCWGIYPSYRMAKSTIWDALKSAIPPQWVSKKNEMDLSITLRGYGSTIALRSADSPDSLRGSGLDLAILDEFSSMEARVWSEVIRPALADRKGGAIIQGSPRGYNALYDLYTHALEADDWQAFKFSTSEGGLVSEDEIALVKESLDARTFAQEFNASFEQSTDRVFLMFSRANIRADLVDPDETITPLPSDQQTDPVAREHWQRQRVPLLCGIDFNISPMTAICAVKVGDECHVVDEITLYNSNTQEMSEVIKSKYPNRRIICFPDPTGSARKTSAGGMTDHLILRMAGFQVVAPRGSYAIVDRVNTTNALLCNVQGRRRLFIHPRCKNLIRGLEQLPYREGTNLPDKSLGIEHWCDGLSYLIMSQFPLVHGPAWAAIHGV